MGAPSRAELVRIWYSRWLTLPPRPVRLLVAGVQRTAVFWKVVAVLVLIAFAASLGSSVLGTGKATDAEAYWLAHPGPDLYQHRVGELAFLYSPAFAQIIAPFAQLPFAAFYYLIMAANVAALVWLVGPIWALALSLILPPVSLELGEGNINLLLAVALVVGMQRAGWWVAFPLTKLSPAVVLVYDLIRGEWRRLVIVLGVTGAIVLVSLAVSPQSWFAWLSFLRANDRSAIPAGFQVFTAPFALRLIGAILLGAIAARRSWPFLLPIAAFLALPVLWTNSLTILLAIPRILRHQRAGRAAGL